MTLALGWVVIRTESTDPVSVHVRMQRVQSLCPYPFCPDRTATGSKWLFDDLAIAGLQ